MFEQRRKFIIESKGFNKFLDLGCGLGRHSIYFAKKDFDFIRIPMEQAEYNMENTEYYSKHFNLIVSKK